MLPIFQGSPGTAIYGTGYVLLMTRKDKLKEGFVARTFHIPAELDEKLKIQAAKTKMGSFFI
jgi:hypothetical protein